MTADGITRLKCTGFISEGGSTFPAFIKHDLITTQEAPQRLKALQFLLERCTVLRAVHAQLEAAAPPSLQCTPRLASALLCRSSSDDPIHAIRFTKSGGVVSRIIDRRNGRNCCESDRPIAVNQTVWSMVDAARTAEGAPLSAYVASPDARYSSRPPTPHQALQP